MKVNNIIDKISTVSVFFTDRDVARSSLGLVLNLCKGRSWASSNGGIVYPGKEY